MMTDKTTTTIKLHAVGVQVEPIVSWLRYQCGLLKHRPRIVWHKLWVRRDEFHPSLDMDVAAMLNMNHTDKRNYLDNLTLRRRMAHDRDLDS